MIAPTLPLPEEPRALKSMARTLLDQAPETGLPLVVAGEWIADPLWGSWGDVLEERGMDRERFGQIVAGYGNELRLWVAGERPWQHSISGLAGRVERRLSPSSKSTGNGVDQPWRDALNGKESSARSTSAASAIVWAGGRPRDPEVPFGEGHSGSSSAALAEALGHFLLKDPAYPPRYASG
jgi:hypothetical protein